MMNILKKNFALLLAVVLCLSMTACTGSRNGDSDTPVAGKDWRTTGVVSDSGTITRDGEDTKVLVCIHAANATFYHDSENKVLFGSVDYPITLESDALEAFRSIDFADLNGDGNSDVTMKFNDGDSELLMVWFWDTESNRFVYRPEESQLGEDDDGNGDDYYSWNTELCQRNVSEFEGTWYYDDDPSADIYIIIDGNGNWSYYQRAPGETEGTEMDYGTFSYSADEVSTYYADSAMYDGLSIRVFEFDEGILIWGDEGSYYRMDD